MVFVGTIPGPGILSLREERSKRQQTGNSRTPLRCCVMAPPLRAFLNKATPSSLVVAVLLLVVWCSSSGGPSPSAVVVGVFVDAEYTHAPCTRAAQAQFQFPGCTLPALRDDLPFCQASFLLSHNAATGYISPNALSKTGLSWWYSKNQVGGIYQQLHNGARALDLRPLQLRNGTVIFQHGAIHIAVSLRQVVAEAVQWCQENPDELVLMLPSHFAYYDGYSEYYNNDDDHSYHGDFDDDATDDTTTMSMSMVSTIAAVLKEFGVPYYDCSAVYDLTVAQVMQLAHLPSSDGGGGGGGHLLVLDGHDAAGTSCAKENWVEAKLVTCYPNSTVTCTSNTGSSSSELPWQMLRPYMLASANNAATDDRSTLGPPATLSETPLNEIQALWQVTTASAVYGMSRLSSILMDNQKSNVNARVMDMVHAGDQFRAISLLAVDHVALHGNALTSVLRTQCGQSSSSPSSSVSSTTTTMTGELLCGSALPRPPLTYAHLSAHQWIALCAVSYAAWFAYSVLYLKRPKLLYTAVSRWRMEFFQSKLLCEVKQEPHDAALDGNRSEELLS